MTAAPIVDWSALGQVVLYSLVAGVAVPAVFALAVLGAARSTEAQRARRGAAATAYALLSLVGGLACLASVVYGIVLMAHK